MGTPVRHLYSLLTYLLRPVAFAIVLWRGLRDRSYWQALSERFALGSPLKLRNSVWIHAVSVGEVTAALPLVRALAAHHPALPLILTTATPTGRARARALFGESVQVRFLPYDTPGSMRRLLADMEPRVAIIMETELWPNLFHQCQRHAVPVVLANARLSPRSVARYSRCGGLFRDVFRGNTFVAAQSAADAERFRRIGAAPERTWVTGNLKFDVGADPAAVTRGAQLRRQNWPERPVWIAGSTHAGEEEMMLDAHAALLAATPNALLLLVPRHPQRFRAVAALLERAGVRFERRSQAGAVAPEVTVLLVDTVGELTVLYGAADVAFVGGSLVPVGGHNLLEPAAAGIPVITGRYQANAREVAASLLREGAALQVADAKELATQIEALLKDPVLREELKSNAERVISANRGSLVRLFKVIESQLATHPDHAADPSTAR